MKSNLTTTYMGLELKNPIIASSSGMTDSVEKIMQLANSGAGAVILKSIFEEQILREIDSLGINNMYGSFQDAENYISFYTKEYNLRNYTDLIKEAKESADIPVIASVNCISNSEWIDYVTRIEKAGADGIELNMFIMPADSSIKGEGYEKEYFDIVNAVKSRVNIPVSLKLSSYFSGMANTLVKLSQTGISGMVLFNRFYTPDINLETEKVVSGNIYSSSGEMGNTLRWISLLSGNVNCSLAASTGIHSGADVLKNILAGADAVQIASVIYEKGIGHIGVMLSEIDEWLAEKGYSSIAEIKGKLNAANVKNPMMYERAQFMKYFSNHY